MSNLPERGQRIRLTNVGMVGVVERDRCLAGAGPNKGKVIDGIAIMKADLGGKYWVTPENWEPLS